MFWWRKLRRLATCHFVFSIFISARFYEFEIGAKIWRPIAKVFQRFDFQLQALKVPPRIAKNRSRTGRCFPPKKRLKKWSPEFWWFEPSFSRLMTDASRSDPSFSTEGCYKMSWPSWQRQGGWCLLPLKKVEEKLCENMRFKFKGRSWIVKNNVEMVYFIHLHIIHCLETWNKHTVPSAWNKTEIITHHQSQPWFHDPKTRRSRHHVRPVRGNLGSKKGITTTYQHRHLTNQQNLWDQGAWGFGSRDKNIRQNRHNMSTPKQQGSLKDLFSGGGGY